MNKNSKPGDVWDDKEGWVSPSRKAVLDSTDLLALLVDRFKKMADSRYEVAGRRLEQGKPSHYIAGVADAYMRCARELERTIEGEEPPQPGEEWPEGEDCRNLCN